MALAGAIGMMSSYSLGYAPLPWVLISELIPLRARATVKRSLHVFDRVYSQISDFIIHVRTSARTPWRRTENLAKQAGQRLFAIWGRLSGVL